MKTKTRTRSDVPTPTELVHHMLYHVGPLAEGKAMEYHHLGIELEAYLHLRGDVRGWEKIDVAQFIGAYKGREVKIVVCSNLAAVLCWLAPCGVTVDLPALYDALLEVCPDDERAHAYIRWGGDLARGRGHEPPAAVLEARRRNAS